MYPNIRCDFFFCIYGFTGSNLNKAFIKREFLENSGHLKDDCFKIRCDVIICEKLHIEDRAVAPAFIDVSASDIFQHFGDLLRSKDGADVAFQVAGETFMAHRCILGARSSVFKAELLGAMKESTTSGSGGGWHTD